MAALVAHVEKMEAGDVPDEWPEAIDDPRPTLSARASVMVRPASLEDTDLEVEMIASPRPFAAQRLLNVDFQPIRSSDGRVSPRPSYADVASGRVSPAILGTTPSPIDDETRVASKEQPICTRGDDDDIDEPRHLKPSIKVGPSPFVTKSPQSPSTPLNFGSTVPPGDITLPLVSEQRAPKKPSVLRVNIVPQVTSSFVETRSDDIELQSRPTYAEVLLTSLGLPPSTSLKRSLTPEPYSRGSLVSPRDDRRRQRSVSPRLEHKPLKRSSRSAFVEVPRTPTLRVKLNPEPRRIGRSVSPRPPKSDQGIFKSQMEFEETRRQDDGASGRSDKSDGKMKLKKRKGGKSSNRLRSSLSKDSSADDDEEIKDLTSSERPPQISVTETESQIPITTPNLPLTPQDVLSRHSVWLVGVDAGDAERRFHERGGSCDILGSKEQFDTDVRHLTTVTRSIERQMESDAQTTTQDEILKALHWELQTMLEQSDNLEAMGKKLQVQYPEVAADLSQLKSIAGKLKELQMQLKRKQYGQQQEVQRRSLVLQELEDWLCTVRTSLSGSVTDLPEKTTKCQEIQLAFDIKKTQLEELIQNVDPSRPVEQAQLKGLANAMSETEKQLQECLQDLTTHSMQMILTNVPCDTTVATTSTALQPVQVGATKVETLPDGSSVFSRQQITSTSVQGSHVTSSVTSRSVTSGTLLFVGDISSMPEVSRAMSAERFVREESSQPEEETIVEEVDGVRRVTVRRVHRVVRQHVVRQRVQVQRMQRRIIYVNGEEVVMDEPDTGEGVEISEFDPGDGSQLHLPQGGTLGRSPSPMVHFPRTPTPGSPSEEKSAFFSIGRDSESPRSIKTPSPTTSVPGANGTFDKGHREVRVRTEKSQIESKSSQDIPPARLDVSPQAVPPEQLDVMDVERGGRTPDYSPQGSVEMDKRSSEERSRSESVEMEMEAVPRDQTAEPPKTARKKHAKKKKKTIGKAELTENGAKDIGKPPISPSSVRKPVLPPKGSVKKSTVESSSDSGPSGEVTFGVVKPVPHLVDSILEKVEEIVQIKAKEVEPPLVEPPHETDDSVHRRHKKPKTIKPKEIDILTRHISDEKVAVEVGEPKDEEKTEKGGQKRRKKKTKKTLVEQKPEFGRVSPVPILKSSIDILKTEVQVAVIVEPPTPDENIPDSKHLLAEDGKLPPRDVDQLDELEVEKFVDKQSEEIEDEVGSPVTCEPEASQKMAEEPDRFTSSVSVTQELKIQIVAGIDKLPKEIATVEFQTPEALYLGEEELQEIIETQRPEVTTAIQHPVESKTEFISTEQIIQTLPAERSDVDDVSITTFRSSSTEQPQLVNGSPDQLHSEKVLEPAGPTKPSPSLDKFQAEVVDRAIGEAQLFFIDRMNIEPAESVSGKINICFEAPRVEVVHHPLTDETRYVEVTEISKPEAVTKLTIDEFKELHEPGTSTDLKFSEVSVETLPETLDQRIIEERHQLVSQEEVLDFEKLRAELVDFPMADDRHYIEVAEISKPGVAVDKLSPRERTFEKLQPEIVEVSDETKYITTSEGRYQLVSEEETPRFEQSEAELIDRQSLGETQSAEVIDISKPEHLNILVTESTSDDREKFKKLQPKIIQMSDETKYIEVTTKSQLVEDKIPERHEPFSVEGIPSNEKSEVLSKQEPTDDILASKSISQDGIKFENLQPEIVETIVSDKFPQSPVNDQPVCEELELQAEVVDRNIKDVQFVPIEEGRAGLEKAEAGFAHYLESGKSQQLKISEITKPEPLAKSSESAMKDVLQLEKLQTQVVGVPDETTNRPEEEKLPETEGPQGEPAEYVEFIEVKESKEPEFVVLEGTSPELDFKAVTKEMSGKKRVEFKDVSPPVQEEREESMEKLMKITGEHSKARRQKSRPAKIAVRKLEATPTVVDTEPRHFETSQMEQSQKNLPTSEKKKAKKRKKKDKKQFMNEEDETLSIPFTPSEEDIDFTADDEVVGFEEMTPSAPEESELTDWSSRVPEIIQRQEETPVYSTEVVTVVPQVETIRVATEEEVKRWEGMLQKLDHQTQLVQRGRRQSLLPAQTASIIPPSTREMESRLDEVLALLSSASRNGDVEERWFVTVEMLLQWMEAIQYYVYMLEQSVDIEWRLEQYKIIVEKVGILARQIPVLQNDASFNQCPPEIQAFITEALENMRQQTVTIDAEMRSNLQEVWLVQQQWMTYMEKVTSFETTFLETKEYLKQVLEKQMSTSESAREFEKLERELLKLRQQFAELQKTGEKLLAKHPGLGINPLLSTTESSISQLHSQLRRHKEGLVQAQGLEEQYEKLLAEYQQLLKTAEVVLERDITAPSAQQLQQTAVQHREFFATIHQYHCLLDSLAIMTDGVTRERCKPLHEQLRTRASCLLVRGLQLGQRLDCLANEWVTLEKKVQKAEEKMSTLSEPVVEPLLLPQALDMQIASYLDSEFVLLKVCALIAEIESTDVQLLCIIQGKPLANRLDNLRCRCNSLFNTFSVILRKLRHVKDNWEVCEKMKDEVECWLNNCSHEIRQLQNHFKNALANKCQLDTSTVMKYKEMKHGLTRQKSILEEFAVRLSQLNVFGILNKKYLNTLEQRLENDYRQLENKFRYIDEHNIAQLCTGKNVSDLRKELMERGNELIEQEQLQTISNVDEALHKCQDILGAGIEFHTLLQGESSNGDTTSSEIDREIAEWQKVNSRLASHVAVLQSVQSIKKNCDDCILDAEKFLVDVIDKLKYLERATELDKHSAELALDKIKDLLNETQNKKMILQTVIQLENEVAASSHVDGKLVASVREQRKILENRWTDLESSIASITSSLSSQIERWNLFSQAVDNVKEQLRKCGYVVDQQTLAALEIEAFRVQIDELENERRNFENGGSSLHALSEAAANLSAKLTPTQAESVNKVEKELRSSWEDRQGLLTKQLKRMQGGLDTWTSYKNAYETLHREIELQEMRFEELLAKYAYLSHSEKGAHVATCKALQLDVETTGKKCDGLHELCRQLQSEVAISPAIKVHSPGEVEYFVQKQVALSTEIKHHCELVSDEMKEVNSFLALLSTIDTFLDKVQKSLAEGSLSATDETSLQEKVTAVKNLLIEFSDLEPCMMTVRESHGRIRLDESEREQARSVIQSWLQLYTDLLQRHHWLQMELVMASDREQRLAKCQFSVEETKNILVSPNAGYADVIQQQRKVDLYQVFLENQQDMLTSQSHLLLQAIPADQLPQAVREVENVMLDTREAIHAANVCLQNLGSHVYLWQTYKQLRDKLAQWLKSLEREKLQLRLKHTPIKKVERILERIGILLSDMSEGETLLIDLESSSRALIEKSDAQTSSGLRSEVGRSQQRFNNLNAGLATWHKFLQRVWQLWSSVESSVGDLHNQLAKARDLLNVKIPSRRVQLTEQQQICLTHMEQVKEMDCKLDELKDHEQELMESIAPSDMKLLHHRVHLLRQLWSGTEHELRGRLHLLVLALSQWENFDRRLQAFEVWIDEMESKLYDKQEMFVEDLITKLETTYRVEMDEKAEEFNSLVALGENLKSSEEMGERNKIEDGLAKVTKRWRALVELRSQRLNALSDLLLLLRQFEELLSSLAKWMKNVELELNTPVSFQRVSMDEIDGKLETVQTVQCDIAAHNGDVQAVLELCRRLQIDCRACTTEGDVTAVEQAAEHFRRRWERVNEMAGQRRQNLEATRESWESVLSNCDRFSTWLVNAERSADSPKLKEMTYEEAKTQLRQNEVQEKQVEDEMKTLSEINRQYRELARSGQVDQNGLMLERVKHLNSSWDRIRHPTHDNLIKMRSLLMRYLDFVSVHQETVAWLAELNQQVSNIEYFSDDKPKEKLNQLQMVSDVLAEEEPKLNRVIETGTEISAECATDSTLQEFNTFCSDLNSRIARLRNEFSTAAENALEEKPPKITLEVNGSTTPESLAMASSPSDTHLLAALTETKERLSSAEASLRSPTPVIFKSEKPPEGYARHLAFCRSSIDLVQHLMDHDVGLNRLQSVPLDVQGVMERWTVVEVEAMEKERRLKDAYKQWCQLVKDLTSMENWLTKAETHDLQMPMDSLKKLEAAVQSYKDFLMDLDAHKPMILSLNVIEQQIIEKENDSPDSHQLQERIQRINTRWEDICRHAVARQSQLHTALLHCHEFEETVADLQSWLELTEESVRQLEPVDLTEDRSINEAKLARFVALRDELETCKIRIASFQHAATQLSTHSEENRRTKDDLDRMLARLQVILHVCNTYIDTLDRLFEADTTVERVALEEPVLTLSKQFFEDSKTGAEPLSTDKRDSEDGEDALARCRQFVSRVLRTALPIQALMLIVLGVASLVPISEQDYSCSLVNNFARSFQPMLHYTDGPPPV